MFYIPLCRDICLWCGAVDAGKKTAVSLLKKGYSLVVYPGGSKEIFKTDPNSKCTQLVKRTGFLRLAMENGCSVVPVFVFGEKWLYSHVHFPKWLTEFFLNRLRVPLLLFWGRWGTYLPYHGKLGVVYGKPMTVPHSPNPTDQEVEEVASRYEYEVRHLFDTYKKQMGYGDDETLEWSSSSSSKHD